MATGLACGNHRHSLAFSERLILPTCINERVTMNTLRWLLVGCILGSVAFADEGDKPVAVVNGVNIGQQAFDELLQQSLKQGGQDTPQLRARLRDQLIARELFLQEAKKRNLDTDPQVLAAVEEAKNNAM